MVYTKEKRIELERKNTRKRNIRFRGTWGKKWGSWVWGTTERRGGISRENRGRTDCHHKNMVLESIAGKKKKKKGTARQKN